VLVLLQDAGGVLHRHAVAGERHQFRAVRDMQIVQRKAGERQNPRRTVSVILAARCAAKRMNQT